MRAAILSSGRALLPALALILGVSCSSKESTAHDSIRTYLRETMFAPGSYESVAFGPLEGGPDIFTMTHSYKEKLASGETVLREDTFCLNKSCLHAISVKKHNDDLRDLEWAIRWNNAEGK